MLVISRKSKKSRGNDEGGKPGKPEAGFRPSQPSWKSLCDFHIPTASTTTIYMDERNEGRTKQCRIVKKAIGSIPHNCYVRGVLVSARFRLRAPGSQWVRSPGKQSSFCRLRPEIFSAVRKRRSPVISGGKPKPEGPSRGLSHNRELDCAGARARGCTPEAVPRSRQLLK